MPTSVIAALAYAVVTSASLEGILLAVAGAVFSYAVKAAFAPKLDKGSAALTQSQTLTSLDSVAPWHVVYGERRKGGIIVFRHVTDTLGQAITNAFFNVPPGAPYTVTVPGVWLADFRVQRFDPTLDDHNWSDMTLVGGAPGANQYAASGGVYTFNAANAGEQINISFYKQVVAEAHNLLHLVIVLAAHEVEAIDAIYFNDEVVSLDGSGNATGKYGGYACVIKHLGSVDQAADGALISAAPDKWTANHRLRGHAYIYVLLVRNRDLFPGGVPNITAVVRGRKVYDPRSTLTVYSTNWALCVADYLNNSQWGLGAPYGTEIDNTLLSAAANASDESVTLKSGGTEPRYTCNGIIDTSATPQSIIEALTTAGAGRLVYIGGLWRISAGVYVTPTVTFDEGDARGAISVKTLRSGRELFNGVKGVYVSPDNYSQWSDFPAVTNATYLAEDGERLWQNIQLPFTISGSMGQRVAKILLERSRRQITASLPLKLSGFKVKPPETLMLNNVKFGYSAKVFEAMELALVPEQDEQGHPVLGVNQTLQETDSAVYVWTSNEEQPVAPAPRTNLPDPTQIGAPGVPTVVEELYETVGGVRVRLLVDWAASSDSQTRKYDLEWKAVDDTQFQQHPELTMLHDVIENVSRGLYDIRVRARSILGVVSPWAQARIEVLGLEAPPADPVIQALRAAGALALLYLEPHPDLDVRSGGLWRVRHSEDESSPLWEEAFSIGSETGFPGRETLVILPLKAGSYLVKAEDSSGQLSVGYADAQTKQASVLAFSPVSTLTESPTFPGTHSHTVAAAGILKLDVDGFGAIEMEGTYTFSAGFNFGSVKRVRLTGHMEGIEVNELDLIDDRDADIDDWVDFDGTGGGSADAWLEARETDDDPTGAPTWGEWYRLDAAEIEAWGVQVRVRIKSMDPSYNRYIDALSVEAEEVL